MRTAVCPTCGAEVTVTYWPYEVPLYTVHTVKGSSRECRMSLRPVEDPNNPRPKPSGGATRPA
ncbi:MAG TPA: hypothetical protein VNF03_15110 [Patescibacteria group bacterium]|jgi:hypothetical protein|nr:hypothetical protein [Patescibacteria group bacterium]